METKLNTSVYDLVKSGVLIAAAVFLFTQVPKMFNDYTSSNGSGVDTTVIEQIAVNAAQATVAESKAEIKRLTALLESQNSYIMSLAQEKDEKIEEIGLLVAKLSGMVEWQASGSVTPDPSGEGRDLEEVLVNFDDAEGNQYPVATVRLSPNLEGPMRWSVEPHDLALKTNILETMDDDGNPVRRAEAWVENHWSALGKDTDGNFIKFPVELKIEEWAISIDRPKKFWYSPRLGATAIVGQDVAVGAHINIFSYGKTKADSDWQFISFGLASGDDIDMAFFTPFKYNIGKPLPLLENLFVGPTAYIDDDSNWSGGVSISIPF